MKTTSVRLLTCLALSAVALAPLSSAQTAPKIEFPAASPTATLKQRVGITDVEITYSRPSARGRTIFGGLVPYDQVWRTGANSATKISFSTAVKLNGTDVPAGKYELFSIPSKTEWTVIIHKDTSAWGAYKYDSKNDVVRFKAKPVTPPAAVETFGIGISDLKDESANLYLAWEKTRLNIRLETDVKSVLVPQIEAVMASNEEKKPYFQAALYYFENNIDLAKAEKWIDEAIAAAPTMFYFSYHKARILAKKGDKAGAIAAAQKSLEGARKAEGSLKEEYIRLNEGLIASLK